MNPIRDPKKDDFNITISGINYDALKDLEEFLLRSWYDNLNIDKGQFPYVYGKVIDEEWHPEVY